MKAKLIGIGAAGNKAAIEVIEQGIMSKEDVLLLNSTLYDVPANYKDIAQRFSPEQDTGGCGKEPKIAENLMMDALQTGLINLDSFMGPEDKCVIIVTSSEGGSGCGASNVVASYFAEVLGVHVHMFVFTGFEEDVRGLANTVHYFQNLNDKYTIQAISNKHFFKGNKLKAEREANAEFAKKVSILLCQDLVESDQNLDETDQIKLVMTPGFMVIEHAELDRIKTVDQFNDICTRMINESSSLEFEPSAIRLGVILNISSRTKDYIDYNFQVLKEKLGFPYEVFMHIQSVKEPEYISVIASGLKLPADDIQRVFNKYNEETQRISKSKDSFFSNAKSMVGNQEDSMFDLGTTVSTVKNVTQKDKSDFFKKRNGDRPMDEKKQRFFNQQQVSNMVDEQPEVQEDIIEEAPKEEYHVVNDARFRGVTSNPKEGVFKG